MIKIEVPAKKDLLIIALSGLVGAFLMSFLNVLFLIPLQFVASKRNASNFLFASLLTLLVGLVILGINGLGIDVLIPLSLLAALFVLNAEIFQIELASWLRIVLASVLSVIGSGLALLIFGGSGILSSLLLAVEANPEIRTLLSAITPGTELEQQLEFLIGMLFRSALFSSSLALLFAYALGRSLAFGVRSLFSTLIRFRLPMGIVWAFIVSLLVLMLGEIANIPALAYLGWNCFLLIALLYFMRGLSTVAAFARKRKVLRRALPIILFLAIIFPGVNLIFFAGLTILGLSSIWIPNLEKLHERKEHESNS